MVSSQKKVSVVKATLKDMPDVAKLSIEMLKYHNVLLDDYFTIFPYDQYVEKFTQKLKDKQCILVAKINSKVVGFILVEFHKTPHYKFENSCIIDEVVVSEKCRSCGIGTALFEKALSICKDKKIEEIKLNVYNANVRAKYLYERWGFKDLRQQMSLVLK